MIFSPSGAKEIAKELGLETNVKFASSNVGPEKGKHKLHGLYAYKTGKYKGQAYFGMGGTMEQMISQPKSLQYRPQPPRIYTQEGARKIAEQQGLSIGGGGYDFIGHYGDGV